MMNLVAGNDALGFVKVVAARIEIAGKAGEVAAGYLDSNGVSLGKIVAGRHG